MKKRIIVISYLTLFFQLFSFSQEAKFSKLSLFSIMFANDSLAGTDRYFTGGIKFTWISKEFNDQREKHFLNQVPFLPKQGYSSRIFISAEEDVYTPSDISQSEFIEGDMPYAGLFCVSFGLHAYNRSQMRTLEINLGVIGPHSYAEQFQKLIHEISGDVYPEGWHHQLKDELTLGIVYEQKWRIIHVDLSTGLSLELMPHLAGGLGNISTYLSTGIQFSLGWNLPFGFGIGLIRPHGGFNPGFSESHETSLYLFGCLDGKSVIRNIFLDGNTFSPSHRVEKYPFTADFILGLGVTKGRFKLLYAYVFWTKRFRTQLHNHVYGVINLTFGY